MKSVRRCVTWMGALVVGLASLEAGAASVAYFLDQSNELSDGTNYLKVTISDSTATVGDIDFRVEVLAANFPLAGSNFGMQTFSFNHDPGLSVGETNIINVSPSWTVSTDKNAGGGFGRYAFELAGTGSTRTSLLTFSITGVGGDSPSSYATVSSLNPPATEFFAAHVADFHGASDSAKFAGSTLVPVPAALWLFGSGLVGLVGLLRRRG